MGKKVQYKFITDPQPHHKENAGKKGGRGGRLTKEERLSELCQRLKERRLQNVT